MMELVVGNSRGSVETGLGLDLGPSGECDVPRQRDVLRIFLHVEVRLIQRKRLDLSDQYASSDYRKHLVKIEVIGALASLSAT